MSRVGILRALASPSVNGQQLSLAQFITELCGALGGNGVLSARKAVPSAASGKAPTACVRHFASDQQEAQSPSVKDGAASGRAAPRPSLKDLLSATSQRIAQGDVSRLLDDPTLSSSAAGAQHSAPQTQTPTGEALSSLEAQLAQTGGSEGPTGADGLATTVGPGGGSSRLLHPKYGYAALGGVLPADSAGAGVAGLVGMLTAQAPRVHPRKRFMPGDTYEPQDLNPFAPGTAEPQRRGAAAAVRRPSVAEVMQKADYKNVAFLSRWFLSPAGRLLPRKQTRLPVQVHRHVSRQIKLARHMGLMAGEARLDKLHLARVREQELAEAQRRLAAGGRYNELLDFGA